MTAGYGGLCADRGFAGARRSLSGGDRGDFTAGSIGAAATSVDLPAVPQGIEM
jgi:hypothetical protein